MFLLDRQQLLFMLHLGYCKSAGGGSRKLLLQLQEAQPAAAAEEVQAAQSPELKGITCATSPPGAVGSDAALTTAALEVPWCCAALAPFPATIVCLHSLPGAPAAAAVGSAAAVCCCIAVPLPHQLRLQPGVCKPPGVAG